MSVQPHQWGVRRVQSVADQEVQPVSKHSSPKNFELDRILLGDCRRLLEAVPEGSVDLVVSSPPYNLGKEYESRVALDHYLEEQEAVLRACCRALKPSGSIFWQVGAFADRGMLVPLDVRFFPLLEGMAMIPRNRIIWARQHGLQGRDRCVAHRGWRGRVSRAAQWRAEPLLSARRVTTGRWSIIHLSAELLRFGRARISHPDGDADSVPATAAKR